MLNYREIVNNHCFCAWLQKRSSMKSFVPYHVQFIVGYVIRLLDLT